MNYKAYPKYKPSGIEWLGNIPEHWETLPIRSFAKSGYKSFVDGDWVETPFIREEGIRLIQTGNIGLGQYKEQGFRYIDEVTFNQFRCTEIQPRDVLICRLADPVGRACLAPDLGVRMITSVDVCILKPSENVDSRYIVYALSCSGYISWMSSICRGGTRDRVSRSMLGSLRIQRPPLNEQRAIASFLDRETGRIDGLIGKKERQIELLKEKRQALISHAVTKGLNPNAKMKPSGIEWLGDIPEHWQLKRVKSIASIVSKGTTPTTVGASFVDQGIRFIKAENIASSAITDEPSIFIDKTTNRMLARSILKKGDVLMVIAGATTGKVAIVEDKHLPANTNQAVAFIRPMTGFSAGFLFFWLLSGFIQEEVWLKAVQSAQPNLSLADIGNFPMVIMPLDESEEIVNFLGVHTQKIDNTLAKIKESIEKLREYRTALISAAVTGKIDVREGIS